MGLMSRHPIHTLTGLLVATAAAGALGGCGSQTQTVSVSGTPSVAHGASASTGASGATSAPTSTSPPSATTSTAAASASATRTATEPAFAHGETQAEGLAQALAVLHERGYGAADTSQYHAGQTLRVLIGTKSPAVGGYDQQAFFFIGSRFLGTDTKEPSATVEVLEQGATEITLGYALYRASGASSSPTGAHATVRFQLNDGKLTALDPIPPASSPDASSRL